jgi:hypothetical protein
MQGAVDAKASHHPRLAGGRLGSLPETTEDSFVTSLLVHARGRFARRRSGVRSLEVPRFQGLGVRQVQGHEHPFEPCQRLNPSIRKSQHGAEDGLVFDPGFLEIIDPQCLMHLSLLRLPAKAHDTHYFV